VTSPVHTMESEDTVTAMLHYAKGAVAMVQATTAAYPGFPERIELNFSQGTATLESGTLQVAFMNGKSLMLGNQEASGGGANPMGFDHAAHRAVLQDFVRAVRSGAAPSVTGRSALNVQRVIATIMSSSQNVETVPLS